MRVAVFGASGQVGRFLLPSLSEDALQVLALGRARMEWRESRVRWQQATLPHAVPVLAGMDAVISLGPLDLFSEWLEGADLDKGVRVLALSSMSAVEKRDSPLRAERELARRLLAAEARLQIACGRAGHAWTLLRPTLIYGAGMDRSLTPIALRAMRWRVCPQPHARGLRQPLHAQDLAQAVRLCLDCRAASGQCIEIGGGERLSVQAMFARLRASLPCSTVPVILPRQLFRCAAAGAGVFPLAAKLARFERDLIADNDVLYGLLRMQPRPFNPHAGDWNPRPR